MIGALTNHLWQSTVFAVVAAAVAFAFRKNRAQVRFWLWLSASLKFLIPFSLLIGLGTRVWDALPSGKTAASLAAPAISSTIVQITQPFSDGLAFAPPAAQHTTNWPLIALVTIWACGFLAITLMRFRGWLRVRAALRSSAPMTLAAKIPIRTVPGLLEPGVVGFLRPVLLLPEGITGKLSADQLEAVLAHEQCHIRRRDNLTSAIHMLVEAVFWFHPLVWWIGAKLVEERERACDEGVLNLGNEPQVYAEGILNVCKSYLESPLRCVSGVTGSDLKKRIRAILTGRVAGDLNFGRRAALAVAAVAAIAVPICIGMFGAPALRAQSSALPTFTYDVASIKLNTSGSGMQFPTVTPDGLVARDMTLHRLLFSAFGIAEDYRIVGEPAWGRQDRWDVEAKMGPVTVTELQKLSIKDRTLAQQQMQQALLADRFKLTFHRESKEAPVYFLEIAKGGPKFHAVDAVAPPAGRSGVNASGPDTSYTLRSDLLNPLVQFLSFYMERTVVDRTGLTGRYDFKLTYGPEDSVNPDAPPMMEALEHQLGLKLESGKATVEVIAIDHVERPSGN